MHIDSLSTGFSVHGGTFDVVVVGAGPAGEVGAIRATQLGFSVAVVEKSPHLGGTCLNVGCIPTKALIASAHTYRQLRESAHLGFACASISYDWHKIMDCKDDIVEQQRKGLNFLLKKNKITLIKGSAGLKSTDTLLVKGEEEHEVSYKKLLIATGSRVTEFPPFLSNSTNILTSDTILFIDHVPKSLAIIGGGVVGMEFACLFRQFGCEVTVYEAAQSILATEDEEVVKLFTRSCQKQGIALACGVKVTGLDDRGKDGVQVQVTEGDNAVFAKVLLSIGRTPATQSLGMDAIGVALDAKGFIPVDLATYRVVGHENIHAVGDVIATQALAHTASAEALRAVEVMAGITAPPIDYLASPSAIYTSPQIAAMGKTEQELKSTGVEYKKIKFPFSPLAKAKIEGKTEGFIKILFGPVYRELLGVHIIHAEATELIAEFVVGKNLETTLDELAHSIHPHPTISETIMEAAHAGIHGAIHL